MSDGDDCDVAVPAFTDCQHLSYIVYQFIYYVEEEGLWTHKAIQT
jgi:hypothetical protein